MIPMFLKQEHSVTELYLLLSSGMGVHTQLGLLARDLVIGINPF
jgi:hypothetical protein